MVKPVEELSNAVLKRLGVVENTTRCMIFSSQSAAQKCTSSLKASPVFSENQHVEAVRFFMPSESNMGKSETHWANFSAIIFPSELWKNAMAFWRDTGSGISSRHAEYCMGELDYLDSDSSSPRLRVPAPKRRDHRQISPSLTRIQAAATSMNQLKAFLSHMATSDQAGQPRVSMDDVFLHPNGMNAIWSLSETLSSLNTNSTVVAFG